MNTSLNLFPFTNEILATPDPNLVLLLLLRLAQRSNLKISSFATLKLIGDETNPLSVMISQNNCTGEREEEVGVYR
ncbi:hypothetical protein [Bartonella bacilliformis]|uniref:hypothetical protein n=1 Tax=Bartonella bacilliformis TaxID=774 RepID=UPI001FD095C4|nr:hypothetical protein [Bartonella bacilliformis]